VYRKSFFATFSFLLRDTGRTLGCRGRTFYDYTRLVTGSLREEQSWVKGRTEMIWGGTNLEMEGKEDKETSRM